MKFTKCLSGFLENDNLTGWFLEIERSYSLDRSHLTQHAFRFGFSLLIGAFTQKLRSCPTFFLRSRKTLDDNLTHPSIHIGPIFTSPSVIFG